MRKLKRLLWPIAAAATLIALSPALMIPSPASANVAHPFLSAAYLTVENRTISVNGVAFCAGNNFPGTQSPCASVSLSGNGYSQAATPNPQLGPDLGKFTFTDVPVAQLGDFSGGTATFTFDADSNSGPLNAVARHCEKTVDIQGATLIGDSYGLGWGGTGPFPY
ncbi:MAG: hypothetical protein ACREP9_11725, partial [Candidatus Dormibacteraceae bacterium]